MSKFAASRVVFGTALIICLGFAGTSLAGAQGLPAPKVGGASTFDAPMPAAGNGIGAARQRISPLAAVPANFATLKLAPGFLLNMEIYDTPEYSTELRIDGNGNVNIPMGGSVHIADLTLVEAANKIASVLKDGKILTDPQVNLNVEQYAGQEVTVLGEVHVPGKVELLAAQHLDDVLALAGGETEYAGKTIEIRHAAGTNPRTEVIPYSRNADNQILSDTVVLPGDTVTVKRAGIVYVLGGVARPGGYLMQEDGDLNVTQALALAYGTTLPAAVSSMRLIRKLPDGKVQELPIPYRDIVKGKVAPPRLQAEDVLYVPISKWKTVVTQGLLASTSQAAIYVYH